MRNERRVFLDCELNVEIGPEVGCTEGDVGPVLADVGEEPRALGGVENIVVFPVEGEGEDVGEDLDGELVCRGECI